MNTWIKDTAERVLFTFLETFLAIVLAVSTTEWDLSTAKAAAIGGVAAALAVIKAAIASRKTTNTVSPASMA